MKKTPLLIGLSAVAVVLIAYGSTTDRISINRPVVSEIKKDEPASAPDVLNSRFVIENKEFYLINGAAQMEIVPDSASIELVRIFGEPRYGDLDGDGDIDAAVLLERTAGGSGVFYYAALAMLEGSDYQTTNTLLLGDRISPQSLVMENGRAVYNFAVRRSDEAFTVPPSIGKSLYIHYDAESGTIGEWVKDFEGESNYTERYRAQVDRVAVIFEHKDFTSYRLVTNGRVREGQLNTERGYENDEDATVFVLDWQKSEGEQMRYVKFTNEPGRLYLLDSAGQKIEGSVLLLD